MCARAHSTKAGSVYGLCDSRPYICASCAVAKLHAPHILSRFARQPSTSSAIPLVRVRVRIRVKARVRVRVRVKVG